ncbi:MAG: glucose-6-phosphate isomerase [Acidimicrobiaceae bacterium]|jgi:glucose-6-phosphate isomerase|nr:glucose-6-phosphate isomerase [Acidimicrobiaceae bacterium]MBT5579673.1 glucose-6-phosphate isomerase [Acidimicrobiaceae bacterium]MBT5851144.1 glucose-6-phosphate isomerase [Acidimicrobiaceae bacterium]
MPAPVRLNPGGSLTGAVATSTRTLADLDGIFADEVAREAMPHGTVVYRVESFTPVDPGTSGGLFFGTSFLEAGRVGDEFFMTRGHVHERAEAAEFYWGIEGEGILLMMDEDREIRAETVVPGSVHYVPGRAAHRLVNTGSERLAVGACWPADAGHDYGTVSDKGFAARVRLIDGEPQLTDFDV